MGCQWSGEKPDFDRLHGNVTIDEVAPTPGVVRLGAERPRTDARDCGAGGEALAHKGMEGRGHAPARSPGRPLWRSARRHGNPRGARRPLPAHCTSRGVRACVRASLALTAVAMAVSGVPHTPPEGGRGGRRRWCRRDLEYSHCAHAAGE